MGIKKFFRKLFNSKKTTNKDYTNSEELIKQRLGKMKSDINKK